MLPTEGKRFLSNYKSDCIMLLISHFVLLESSLFFCLILLIYWFISMHQLVLFITFLLRCHVRYWVYLFILCFICSCCLSCFSRLFFGLRVRSFLCELDELFSCLVLLSRFLVFTIIFWTFFGFLRFGCFFSLKLLMLSWDHSLSFVFSSIVCNFVHGF